MSYLEYTVKTTPSGLRKILYLNWPLALLLTAVAGVGFLMLYSVAGGSFQPWGEAQMKRFGLGFALMIFVAMIPIYFWRNVALLAYLVALALLVAVEFFGAVGMGAQRWIDLGFMRLQPSELKKITLVMVLAANYDWLPLGRTSKPAFVLIPVILCFIPGLEQTVKNGFDRLAELPEWYTYLVYVVCCAAIGIRGGKQFFGGRK